MRDIKPQGAVAIKDKEKLEKLYNDPNWIAERKYDGSRYILQILPEGIFLTSRRESVNGGMCEKSLNVPQIVEEAKKLLTIYPKGIILDGEVDVPGNIRCFKMVQGVMGSLPERAIALQTGNAVRTEMKKGKEIILEGPKLVYKVFDILERNGEDLRNKSLRYRRSTLEETLFFGGWQYIKLVEQYKEDEKRHLYEEEISIGAEGIMLKNLDAIYQEDKCPANVWVKVKGKETYDGIVKGYKYGEQVVVAIDDTFSAVKDIVKVQGWQYEVEKGKYKVGDKIQEGLGTLTTYQYHNGELVEVAEVGGIPYALRAEFKAKLDRGETFCVEFEAYGLFEDTHRYRHPSFKRVREDKNEKDCLYGKA